MKTFLLFNFLLITGIPTYAKENIEIAGGASVELNYAEFEYHDVQLINYSGKPIAVSVVDPKTKKQVQGFGLGPIAKAIVSVEQSHTLKLTNHSLKKISLSLVFVEKKPSTYDPEEAPVINFVLHNSSFRSIPLVIPNVMNPNLSPMSNSGVALRIGQQIFYRKGSQEFLILTVDASIQQGQKIDLALLVKDLKKIDNP